LRRTAKHTANIGVQFMTPVSERTKFVARVDASYRSKMFTDLVNAQWTPDSIGVDGRIGVESKNYGVFMWVKNLTNRDEIESTNTFNSDLNSFNYVTTAVNISRRRFGATLSYKW
jgi:outer membrane receptor protein involved in Fe transport